MISRRRFVCAFPVALFLSLISGAPGAQQSQAAATPAQPAANTMPSAQPIDTDRGMEIDLYWFRQQDIGGSSHEFWERFAPLYAGAAGYRGVILNIGWTVGPVMRWSRNLDQRISPPTGSGEAQWVDECELQGCREDVPQRE